MKRLALLCLLFVSCAPTIEALEAAFERALPMAGGGDCGEAGELRHSICSLADRVCEQAKEDRTFEEKCALDRARCERAKERMQQRCASGAVDSRR